MRQIAQIIGKIGVEAVDDRLMTVGTVLAEGNLAQEEITHRIHAITGDEVKRVDDVPNRFRHLLAAHVEKTMTKDTLGQRHAR